MTEMRDVPVKSWLTPTTFRSLHRRAEQRGTTVGHLLSVIADAALTQKPAPVRRSYVRMTPARIAEARELYRLGWSMSEIAKHLGVSRSTIENHKTRLTEGEHA